MRRHCSVIDYQAPLPRLPEVLTTGQFARICRVAPRTVSKWCDGGKLQGYRLPGSLDRRIPVAEAVRFLRDSHMPIPPELLPGVTVSYGLAIDERFAGVEHFACPFEFGRVCGRRDIVSAVVGDCDGAKAMLAAAGLVREVSPFARIVAVVGEDCDASRQRFDKPGLIDETFRRPANWPLIISSMLAPVEKPASRFEPARLGTTRTV